MTFFLTIRFLRNLITLNTIVFLLPVILTVLAQSRSDSAVYFNYHTESPIEVKYGEPLYVVSTGSNGGLKPVMQPGRRPSHYRFTGSSNDLGEQVCFVPESDAKGTVHMNDKLYVKVHDSDYEYWGWWKDIFGKWYLVKTINTDRAVFTIQVGIVSDIYPPRYYYNFVSCVEDDHCSAFKAFPEDDDKAFVTPGPSGVKLGTQIQFQPGKMPRLAAEE